MKNHSHLRLVPDPPEEPEPRLLSGPPWTWLALVAATVVAPVARKVSRTLAVYESTPLEDLVFPQESIEFAHRG